MLALLDTNDRLRLVSSSAADLDVVAHMVNYTSANALTGFLKQLSTINSATTTTICTEPAGTGGDDRRNIKQITIRNRHASTSNDVTILFQDNATNYEICKFTLRAGDTLQYQEGVGWYLLTNEFKLDVKLRVTADSVHATAATLADITGLTYPVESGKNYGFEAHLIHIGNATTTGAQFAANGPTSSPIIIGEIDVTLNSATVPTFGAGSATALNTVIITETTGAATNALAIIAGGFTTSAAGTFAMRATSEVTVAAGLTVKAGSWCHLFEMDN